MAPLDIVDGSYADEDKSFSAQDTVNYLPTSAEQAGTRTPTMLKTPPGLKPAVLIGVNEGEAGMQVAGPVRGTYNAEGRFFAVAGNQLFQISSAGIAIPLGTVPGVGRVSFAHNQVTNGNEILVNNGNAGYIYSTVTQVFQRITDTSYPGGLKAVFINNRFVQIEPARRYAFNSALANGLEYTALDRFTSETSPDLLVSIESIGNQLATFSSTTTEWFEDTGASPQPFRSTGIVADKGAAGPFATAKMDNQLFVLADDGVFYRFQGYNPVRISTKPIEQAIRGKNWLNAFTTVWEDSGFAVCYWTFPDGETWGYDASSGKWHRRESYGFNRWRLNSLTFWQNAWYGGDFQNGRLWRLDWDYLLEGDDEIVSSRAAGVISDNQNRVIHERLELVMNTGMEETVPDIFVDQPEGPTISGDAPDGVVGIAWGPYSYTVTGGTPPYIVGLRPGGSLPGGIGPISAAGVIASGTPEEAGDSTFRVRATDSKGLFSEIEDSIKIDVNLAWVASVSGGGSINLYSNGGFIWSVENDLSGPYSLAAGNGKLVAYKGGSSATSVDGLVWVTDTAPATGVNTLIYSNGLFVGVGLVGGCVSSPDGVDWTVQNIGNVFNYEDVIFFIDKFIAAGAFYVQGSSDAISWSTLSTNPLLNSDSVRCLATDQNTLFAGGDSGKMAKSEDAVTWTPITSPFGAGNSIDAAAYGLGLWCASDITGSIFWSADLATWVDTGFTLGATPARMRYLSGRFVVVGASGAIAYSIDGKEWTSASIPGFTDPIIDVAGLEL